MNHNWDYFANDIKKYFIINSLPYPKRSKRIKNKRRKKKGK